MPWLIDLHWQAVALANIVTIDSLKSPTILDCESLIRHLLQLIMVPEKGMKQSKQLCFLLFYILFSQVCQEEQSQYSFVCTISKHF